MRHVTDEEDCHTAYHALFTSHLCFGIVAWGAACNQDMQKILNLEKKTSELSTNCPPVSHTSKKKSINTNTVGINVHHPVHSKLTTNPKPMP